MERIATILAMCFPLAIAPFGLQAQWVVNGNGDTQQSNGNTKILIGGLPSWPGKLNIAPATDEPHLWLNGGPIISSATLLNQLNINIGTTAGLGLITTNPGGFGGVGMLEGPNLSSPIVWMYNSTTNKNAFTVARANYRTTGLSTIDNTLTPLFQVRENGNVGIGTTSPGAKLDVGALISGGTLGTVFGRLQEGNSTGEGTYLGVRGYDTQPVNGKSFAIEHGFYGSINSSISFNRGNGTTGGFITFNTNNNTEQVRITSSGNVGIGSLNPNQKLTVNGTIYGKEVKVDLSVPGPDYVFEKSYNLPTLEEIKTYIDQNKHLPEVPSAAEMEKNGVKLGEMNMLLLKKVEELTLYVIEANRKIKAQDERIDWQQKEMKSLKTK